MPALAAQPTLPHLSSQQQAACNLGSSSMRAVHIPPRCTPAQTSGTAHPAARKAAHPHPSIESQSLVLSLTVLPPLTAASDAHCGRSRSLHACVPAAAAPATGVPGARQQIWLPGAHHPRPACRPCRRPAHPQSCACVSAPLTVERRSPPFVPAFSFISRRAGCPSRPPTKKCPARVSTAPCLTNANYPLCGTQF